MKTERLLKITGSHVSVRCKTDTLSLQPLWEVACGLSNRTNSDDLEWPWRSVIYCKLFQMWIVEHRQSASHNPFASAELLVYSVVDLIY